MKRVLLLDVVGLSARQIGARTPSLAALAARGCLAPMRAVLPAVTLSAQATMLTGLYPAEHGVVGNGWYFDELGEAWLWRQPNSLVQGPKLYERARALDPSFTCAKLFWWWNLGAAVDWSLTPRPYYPADGRKIPAIYGTPRGFEHEIEGELGPFPFFDFWGPKAGLASSEWLTRAALRVLREQGPSLTLLYLPHLDYDHQRFGPDHPRSLEALSEVDALVGRLVAAAEKLDVEIVVVSEYALEAVDRPIHINRALRRAGLLQVRETPVGEVLDPIASRAFAVADHQLAHVYAKDAASTQAAARCLSELEGIAEILDRTGKSEHHLDHPRAGTLVALADRGAWFTYYYWLEDSGEPDFARTVDIHRKPGYDPCELFVDPGLRLPALRVARRLLQKKIGMRMLMDVVPVAPELVRGSHGRLPDTPEDGPVFLSSVPFDALGGAPEDGVVSMTSVPDRVLRLLQR